MASTNLDDKVALLCERITALEERHSSNPYQRILIAIAGVPGSGKSTITAALMQALGHVKNVTLLPLDGFHFPKATLSSFKDPEMALRRRGAPFTFDAAAFMEVVQRLSTSPVTSEDGPNRWSTCVPSFDHAIQDPIEDDIYVSSSDRIVILEGNYLLLDEPPWNIIADQVDERWFVHVPSDIAKERLVERHLRAGIDSTREAAMARVEENDLQNGDPIRAKLITPDFQIEN